MKLLKRERIRPSIRFLGYHLSFAGIMQSLPTSGGPRRKYVINQRIHIVEPLVVMVARAFYDLTIAAQRVLSLSRDGLLDFSIPDGS